MAQHDLHPSITDESIRQHYQGIRATFREQLGDNNTENEGKGTGGVDQKRRLDLDVTERRAASKRKTMTTSWTT